MFNSTFAEATSPLGFSSDLTLLLYAYSPKLISLPLSTGLLVAVQVLFLWADSPLVNALDLKMDSPLSEDDQSYLDLFGTPV